ncbi:MAG: hypothetical protein ACJ754_28880 [Pyrinomonadaceae bacterium]
MKRFPRLSLIFSLLLLASVWPGGSPVDGAKPAGAVAGVRSTPPSSVIESFTITPSVINKGQEISIRWRVSEAAHIWMSANQDTPDLALCIEGLSGERRFSPDSDVIYKLHVWNQGMHELKEATVQVNGATGVCTIAGEVTNDRRENLTRVQLFRLNSTTPTATRILATGGEYRFTDVPTGIYRVVPTGRYRNGVGPVPSFYQIDCWPHELKPRNFRIGGSEG